MVLIIVEILVYMELILKDLMVVVRRRPVVSLQYCMICILLLVIVLY